MNKLQKMFSSAVSCVKRNTQKLAVAAVGGAAALAATRPAHAAGLTVPTIDLTDFYAGAVVILTAAAGLWVAYKVIGLIMPKRG